MAEVTRCFLGLGGNLPFAGKLPIETIAAAVQQLEIAGVKVVGASSAYDSSPVPATDQPDFTNAVIAADTHLSAGDLLAVCKSVERLFGREPGERWSARTLDIDILAYGELVTPEPDVWRQLSENYDPEAKPIDLALPHLRMHLRAFALAPFVDVAPNWQHPVLGKTAKELLADVEAAAPHDKVERLPASIWR